MPIEQSESSTEDASAAPTDPAVPSDQPEASSFCAHLSEAAALLWPDQFPTGTLTVDDLVATGNADVTGSDQGLCYYDSWGPASSLPSPWRRIATQPDSSDTSQLPQCHPASGALGSATLIAFCPESPGYNGSYVWVNIAGSQYTFRYLEGDAPLQTFDQYVAATGVMLGVSSTEGCCVDG